MNQIRTKQTVTAIADRLKKAGKPPVLRTVCSVMDTQKMAGIQIHPALSNGWRCHSGAVKTHVVDLVPDLQHVLAEEFERVIIDWRAKLESEYSEVKKDRDKLANLNQRQSAKIEFLTAALREAGAKVDKQARRIEQLKNEIAAERESRGKIEQRIRDARQALTKVEHRLDDPFPESGGGA